MNDELYRTAIHESGHAVLGELLYLDPEYVTIEPTADYIGYYKPRIQPYTGLGRWRGLLESCGGLIAEEISFDDFSSYDTLSVGWLHKGTDGAKLWAVMELHSEDESRQWEWFELAYAQAQRILSHRAVWRSVESLAARLMEKRTLDYADAADVIKAALGRTKWNREQFRMAERYASPPQTWIDSREEYRELAQAMAAALAREAK